MNITPPIQQDCLSAIDKEQVLTEGLGLLPSPREGQYLTMTISGTDDPAECGHWSSPAHVQWRIEKALAVERTRCAMDDCIGVHSEIANGGDWLRAARTWMQSNVPRGDTLCWGDRQPVTVPFAVLEDLARTVAIAAVLAERRKSLK